MLEIDFALLITTIAVFLFLIAFLNKILYKPMLNFMNERELSILADEELSKKNSSEVSVYEAQVEEMLISARNKANKIKQSAYEDAKIKNQKSIEDTKKQIDMELNEYLRILSLEKKSLKAKLKSSLPEFRGKLEKTLARI